MTPEDVDTLASKIAAILASRGWVPETVRPEPPERPRPESIPAWAGSAQQLGDVAPAVGKKTRGGVHRPDYGTIAAATRGAAAGTAPSPLVGRLGSRVPKTDEDVDIRVAVSGAHLHVSARDFSVLFGSEQELSSLKPLAQPGQFAAEQQVRIVGPEGTLERVRIVGPLRELTQVELASSDYRDLGIEAPLRRSGDLKGSAGVRIQGPAGNVNLEEGAIVTARHLHLGPECSSRLGLDDGDRVDLIVGEGDRRCLLPNVFVRAGERNATELHIDKDEAHAFGVRSGDAATIAPNKASPAETERDAPEERRLVTERDVDAIAARGDSVADRSGYILTPSARDRAKALGIWSDLT